MRILGPIVLPSPALMPAFNAEIVGCCAVGAQIIRDQSIGNDGVFPQKLAHQFQRGVLVALGLDQHIQNLAPGVDGAPQIDHAPIDFQIDLVKMPDRMRSGTALAQLRCNDRPEMIHPASDCLVRNCNSALGEQILDVTKAEREPEIEPDRLVNDLRREPISGLADFRHALRLPSRRRRDNATAMGDVRAASSSSPSGNMITDWGRRWHSYIANLIASVRFANRPPHRLRASLTTQWPSRSRPMKRHDRLAAGAALMFC